MVRVDLEGSRLLHLLWLLNCNSRGERRLYLFDDLRTDRGSDIHDYRESLELLEVIVTKEAVYHLLLILTRREHNLVLGKAFFIIKRGVVLHLLSQLFLRLFCLFLADNISNLNLFRWGRNLLMVLLDKHLGCILRENRKVSCCWRDVGGAKAGYSFLNEVNLVKRELHEVDLTNVSELLWVSFLLCLRRVAHLRACAEPRFIFTLWLGLIHSNEPCGNLGLAWIKSHGLEQEIWIILTHSLCAKVRLTLHHDLLNSILSKIWKLYLFFLLINLKIHLELINDGLECRPKWPVLLLNLNAFHWAGLALWVLPSIYYPHRLRICDLVRINLLADSLLVVGHSLLFWELGRWAGEVLGVEELLEFFAVWDLHSGFRLGVETEEDRAALLSSADANYLDRIVLCYQLQMAVLYFFGLFLGSIRRVVLLLFIT
jgi:hypothetical protein